jgi:(p)ppGpp synthase/HD superfamily hydrolase
MTTHHSGFSDRIAHALSYAAKHGATPSPRGGSTTWPTRPANVAVILARYGCDELTIVSGVLVALLSEVEPSRQRELETRVGSKFGDKVVEIVRQVLEPRYDARGRERGWEACKLDYLANLALCDQRALDVSAANEIHQCGALVSDVRRLGIEYLSSYAPGGAATVVRWFTEVVQAYEGHPTGPRPGMLAELRDLTSQLAADVSAEG